VIGDAFGPKLLALQEHAWEREDSTLVLIAGALVGSIGLLVRGRVKLPRSRVGENVTMQDGKAFRIFVRSSRTGAAGPPGGKFLVRFTTKMPPRANEVLSWLTIMVFMGLPG
jgi:hypothetical protein